jgi:hypothetical protein
MVLVIDMAFKGTINIGGIQYTFNPTKEGINYLFRSYKEFDKTFTSVADLTDISLQRIRQLFITYFRVEPFVEQKFADIKEPDKGELITIFEAYLGYLQRSKEMSGNTVVSTMLNRTYFEILNILNQLKGKGVDVSAMSPDCQDAKTKIVAITPSMRDTMINELTWILEHPNDIRSEAQCKWAIMAAELSADNYRITEAASQIKKKEVSTQTTQSGGGDHDKESRMKALMIVSTILNAAKKHGYHEEEDCQELQQIFSDVIASLFSDVKKMYRPVYVVIENCMKRNHVKKNKIIMPLLQLQHLSNHFIGTRKEAYGIYRLRNTGKRLISYLTSQLQCISSTLDNMTPADQRVYRDAQKMLSPFSPTCLPKRKGVVSSKKGVVLPRVQFMILDGNLIIPPFQQFYRKGSESEKEQFYQVMTDFFTKDNIYMTYSETDEIPLHFYDINFPSVDTTDSYISVTDYDSKRIVENHVLQDFCTFVPHATYTNAELVLSIFIALKEKRTK